MRIGIIAVLGLCWLTPSPASAHPMLDRAVAAYEDADFGLALRTFDTASRNADLTVEELLQLFEMRALVYHALGDHESMKADLERLAAVRGSYQLGRLAPPSVREVFEEVREAHTGEKSVELRIEEKRVEEKVWVVASVLRVPEDLVDHTTLQCNVDNNVRTVSKTSRGTTTSVELPASGVHNGCSATARTRQGGVLFNASIDGAPVLMPTAGGERLQMSPDGSRRDAASKKKKWPWIVAASAVLVAGGITAGVLLSRRSEGGDDPQIGGVTVSW